LLLMRFEEQHIRHERRPNGRSAYAVYLALSIP
jgi:hypothetical protein